MRHNRFPIRFYLIILSIILLIPSCSRVYEKVMGMEEDFISPSIMGETVKYEGSSLSKSRVDWNMNEMDSQLVSDTETPDEVKDKKRIYSGDVDLLVEDLEKTKLEIESYAGQLGGYVESTHSNSIIIRVPAANFNETFDWILLKGKVRYQSIETADVTEFYNDLFSRLEISIISRDRLYELLTHVTDTTEQVQILKEIGRLTEDIQSTKLLLQSLESFISYSRISISLESRLQLDQISKQEIPFSWIRNLSPLYTYASDLKAKIELEPGENFAVFDKENIYTAENWDGAKIRISTVINDPVGDGDFWEKALLFHLKDFYANGEVIDVSFGTEKVFGVLWTSRDSEAFQYYTGVVVDKKELHLIEIFSPTEDKDLFEGIFKAMTEGELK